MARPGPGKTRTSTDQDAVTPRFGIAITSIISMMDTHHSRKFLRHMERRTCVKEIDPELQR